MWYRIVSRSMILGLGLGAFFPFSSSSHCVCGIATRIALFLLGALVGVVLPVVASDVRFI
tara:strand:+ start:17424 stop:17603 length:180 start_codon:yes stop_codon:yes gene_type:complete